ncbi:hypothetical protein Tsubulata_008744 [Turnera subulata]|uniref:MADS-box domain-containing protein n=1 Tax=Turnera subulata TaxID=218843 RepID=A0A9Q0G4F4_9ROSI|nr:hypothetical protein Tsubulata_008744 [Turnera subulata]
MVTLKKQQKQTKGRQKIEIKPIQEKSHLQVTFSKRRTGLVKKASELALLCGAEVAILAFSPGNKIFSFGHPNVEATIDRYLNESYASREAVEAMSSANNPRVQQWNREHDEALKELEEQKKGLALIQEWNKASEDDDVNTGIYWWNQPIDNMGLEELEGYLRSLQELKKNLGIRASELMAADQFGGQIIVSAGDGGFGSGDRGLF